MSVSRQRAEQKRAVLSAWVSRGVPDGKLSAVPRSLNEARLWNDVDLGVERIGSKSEFTRNHPDVGPVVIEIERLVAILLERTKPRHKRSKRPNNSNVVSTSTELEQTKAHLAQVVSQWHMLRQDLLFEKQVTNEAKATIQDLRRVVVDREREITDLRQQVESTSGSRR